MTIAGALAEAKKNLAVSSPFSSVDTPALDASLLLAEVLRLSRVEIIARGNEEIGQNEREEFFRLIERRKAGECVAYILGRREFRGLDFKVSPDVLVPRPDSETLVEAALEYIDFLAENSNGKETALLDLCTGSGALAISLKNERPFLSVSASDISHNALEIAGLNALELLGGRVSPEKSRVNFTRSDLFSNVNEKYNIIVSNPPYIPSRVINTLAPEVRKEPRIALDGGDDGLELIRKIIPGALERLLPGGVLLLEADPEEMSIIALLFEKSGYKEIKVRKDLAARDRVISAMAKR